MSNVIDTPVWRLKERTCEITKHVCNFNLLLSVTTVLENMNNYTVLDECRLRVELYE